jgi:hypothetical protein
MLFLNFYGAGWLFPFYFGVAQYFQEVLDLETPGKIMVGGVSAGSVTAVLLLLKGDFDGIYEMIVKRYGEVRYNPFKMKECLEDVLAACVPEDQVTLARCNNRLIIGLSAIDMCFWRRKIWKSHEVSKFDDKCSLINTIKASCHIPFISGVLPYQGYFDGQLAGLESRTNMTNIVIDICDTSETDRIGPGMVLPELWRFYPCDPFIMRTIHKLGYEMARKFIFEHIGIFKNYLKRNVKNYDPINIRNLQDILEYSKRKNEICKVRSPIFTLFELFSIQKILMIVAAFIFGKWIWIFRYKDKKMKKRA